MVTRPIVEGVNRQVTIYKDGAVSTAQEGRREGESQSELNRRLAEGWSTTQPNDGRTLLEGTSIAQALYSFLPDEVIDEFAKAWVKSGDSDVAISTTRQTKAWKDNFGKLMRNDGTLVCLLYTSPSPRDVEESRMPSSA